jgi:hypothetical protein
MANFPHSAIQHGENHVIHSWEVADATARTALSVQRIDIGRVCRQLSDNTFWVLRDIIPATWRQWFEPMGSNESMTITSPYTSIRLGGFDADEQSKILVSQVNSAHSGANIITEDATGGSWSRLNARENLTLVSGHDALGGDWDIGSDGLGFGDVQLQLSNITALTSLKFGSLGKIISTNVPLVLTGDTGVSLEVGATGDRFVMNGAGGLSFYNGTTLIKDLISEKMSWGLGPPSTGTWAQGHVTWNSSAAVGQPNGWRCTVAGTPGTWVAMADL